MSQEIKEVKTRKKKKLALELPLELGILTHAEKPKTRFACREVPRPCPYVSCRYHLYLDVFEGGVLKINHKGVELEKMPFTCALDAADTGEMELDQIANTLNLTRERVRQILEQAFQKIRSNVGDEVTRILFSFHEPD